MAELQALITQQWPDLQVEQPLGSGACGTVFACTRKSETTGIENKEAVKVVEVLFPETAHRRAEEDGIPFEEYYQRIKAEKSREIELLIALKSPHIVHINEFRAVETPDRSAFYLLILMDRLAPLDTLRAAHGQDTPEQAAALAKKVCLDLCEALRVCHENGVCHRDIKPANILYGSTGDFYLGDFGVSQYAAAPESTLTYAETAAWDFGKTETGQALTTTADGQHAAIVAIYHDTTMHGALQIKVNADADDLVLYYNQQPYLYGTAYPYSFWDCAGWTGTFRLDEMYNLLGMPYLRFYRLRDLADQFATA